MRHFLMIMLCLSIALTGCQNSGDSGGGNGDSNSEGVSFKVNNPGKVSDAETTFPVHSWVPDVLKIDRDKVAINLCIQDGLYIYFVTMDKTASREVAMTEVFNAKHQKVCQIGGTQMGNSCPDFTFDGSKDCHAIFLK